MLEAARDRGRQLVADRVDRVLGELADAGLLDGRTDEIALAELFVALGWNVAASLRPHHVARMRGAYLETLSIVREVLDRGVRPLEFAALILAIAKLELPRGELAPYVRGCLLKLDEHGKGGRWEPGIVLGSIMRDRLGDGADSVEMLSPQTGRKVSGEFRIEVEKLCAALAVQAQHGDDGSVAALLARQREVASRRLSVDRERIDRLRTELSRVAAANGSISDRRAAQAALVLDATRGELPPPGFLDEIRLDREAFARACAVLRDQPRAPRALRDLAARVVSTRGAAG